MTAGSEARPPYRAALAVSLVVLLGYLVSLAPSVTFWDAGEFVASMKILGIPHPPGTPLFVMMGHVWGMIFPVGEFAFRTNLLSALCSSAGAGCWFLVLQESAGHYLEEMEPRGRLVLQTAAGAAGALIAAFGFTNWLNSNETEVYAVATFTIAAVCWLLLRWRAARGTPRAPRYLLLVGFFLGIAIGNHLLGLLVGPAVVAFIVAELRYRPSTDAAARRREWGYAATMTALWCLLLGIGLGNGPLIMLGVVAFLSALAFASFGNLPFGALLLFVALIGVTPYLYLYIRSAQHPMLNEAGPETLKALTAVIRREQYEVRTPWDDPTVRHGPGNPGRSLTIIGLQLANYGQYFDWQWAKAAPGTIPFPGGGFAVGHVFTLLFLVLGLMGMHAHWRSDRTAAWLLGTLWLTTGIGLLVYMNFKPGFSLAKAYELFPRVEQHEVRDRDYFFVVSFVVWGLWAGLGLLALVREWGRKLWGVRNGEASRPPVLRQLLPLSVFLVAVIPFALNFREADRQHGPDARLPGDFAYDLLNSVPPYGVLFTYGDNDTFPLWWAQEVEGIRKDVTVVCLALAETDWYMRQLRDNPVRPFEEDKAPPIWRGLHPVAPTWPLHTMTNDEIAQAVPQIIEKSVALRIGGYQTTIDSNTVLYGKDFLVLRVIQQNFGRRPIAWGLTATGTNFGLDRFLVQRGLAITLETAPVDTTTPGYDYRRLMGAPLDVAATERLMTETYRYAGLLTQPKRVLESTASGIASTLGLPYTQLAFAMQDRADSTRMLQYLERAALLTTNPAVQAALDQVRKKLPSTKR